ncbi:MAG TPA: oxygen-independent coproporphyrinogen III oxidase [Dongiaceae bacterium]|jgi:oxygen-independent coproporphyrinogen-3 oxidase|nr:oxygen-independent coproporphyrinogen III oxidase [Dongiaceae bacterium]
MTIDPRARRERQVPRYTSYPTAPQFHAGIGAETYRRWLGALDPAAPVSLYLHVPFCRRLCWYCGCNTHVASRYRLVATYRDFLLAEIDHVAAALSARLKASRIHWGGGTPTILSPEDFLALHARLRLHFDIGPESEIAIEIDPRVLEKSMVAALAEAGVRRASLGVQDFDPGVQRAINRWQPYERTAAAADALRAAGIGNINLDLIYGLPHQTLASLLHTIDLAIGLEPQRIALFGYAHVPWLKPHQRLLPAADLPGPAARWDQAMGAAERLRALGYEWIGLDHFALPGDDMAEAARTGRLRRNFQGYTTDDAETLLGFGASAIGRLPQGYVQNIAEVKDWEVGVGGGDLPIARGIALDDDDRLRRLVIERLMCDLEVDLAACARAFGETAGYFAQEREALTALEADGLAEIENDRIRLTAEGRPLMRLVAAVFDRYLAASAGRHAAAV